jgi:hypothetical protein
MMHVGLQLMLLVFAGIGFGGAGAALAVARQRHAHDGERDVGMISVATLLSVFAALCAAVGSGVLGVVAFGGVVLWISYTATAQRIGLFRIETGILEGEPEGEPRRTY